MRIIILGVLLASVAIAESQTTAWPSNPQHTLASVTSLVAGLFLFNAIISTVTASAISHPRGRHTRTYLRVFEPLLNGGWLATIYSTYFLTQWPAVVRSDWRLERTLLLDELVLLAPLVVTIINTWFSRYRVERALDAAAVIRTGMTAKTPTPRQYIMLHIRHYLGMTLVPVLVVFAINDAAQYLQLTDTQSPWFWLFYLTSITFMIGLAPMLIPKLWQTEPLPAGPLRERLSRVADQLNLKLRDILVWKTGSRATNAAVTGFFPRFRYLLLSDGLLESLADEDISSILLHEGGHVRRGHGILRVLVLLAPLTLYASLLCAVPEFPRAFFSAPQAGDNGDATLAITVGLAAIFLYGLLVVGGVSRILELDADCWACLQAVDSNSQSIEATTQRYSGSLLKLHAASGTSLEKSTWLHPSTLERINLVRCVSRSRPLARRIQFSLNLLRWSVFVVALIVPICLF